MVTASPHRGSFSKVKSVLRLRKVTPQKVAMEALSFTAVWQLAVIALSILLSDMD